MIDGVISLLSIIFVTSKVFYFSLLFIFFYFCQVGSRNGNVLTQSFGAWADCLTNVSMGQLIGDTVDANNCNLETLKGGLCPQQMLTCDSFDAAIAAHISRYWNAGATNYVSQMSVLDAEDTCHAFPVKKFDNLRNSAPQPSPNMFTEMIGKKATSVSISSSGPIDVRFFFFIAFIISEFSLI